MIYYLFLYTYWFPLPSILVGIVLFLYYKIIQKSRFSISESLLLLFLPSYGLGNWIYNIEMKKDINKVLPKKWYIYEYMYKVHIVLVILVLNFFSLISSNYFKNFNYTAGDEYVDVLMNNFQAAGHFVIDVISYLIFFIIGLLFIFIPFNIAKSIKINHLISQKSTNPANFIKKTYAVRYENETDTTNYYQFTNLYASRQIVVKDGNVTLLTTENPVSDNYKLTDKLLNEFNFNADEYIGFEEFKKIWNQKK